MLTAEPVVRVGCPPDSIRLSPATCVKFLTETCAAGCSRYAAMAECEQSGGFLLDQIPLSELQHLLVIAGDSHSESFWWTGAADFE